MNFHIFVFLDIAYRWHIRRLWVNTVCIFAIAYHLIPREIEAVQIFSERKIKNANRAR